jgi:RNA polymerase primary sigma factor
MTDGPAPLSAAEERRLALLARGGDSDARNRLIEANVRLVAHIARRLRPREASVSSADLIQEGVLGLMRAVDRFDPDRGHRFSTYATWWIRSAVLHALSEEARPLRLPSPVARRARELAHAEAELRAELGREPTPRELASRLGADESEVAELRRAAQPIVSLHAPAGGIEDVALVDLLADEEGPDPLDGVARDADAAALAELLEELPPRDRRVVELRFGLGGAQAHSVAEAARALGTSRARVRLIEEHALARLRSLAGARELLVA